MRKRQNQDEFYQPMPEEATGAETSGMPVEGKTPAEPIVKTSTEFEGKSGGPEQEENNLHRMIKKLILMPLASTVAAVTIVFASFGTDPLGDDFLEHPHDDIYEEIDDISEGNGKKSSHSGGGSDEGGGSEGHGGSEEHGGSNGGHGSRENVREFPGDLSEAYVHVLYVPTGERYDAPGWGSGGMNNARNWVKEKGGDPDSLTHAEHYYGTKLVANGPIVGDPDNLANAYDPWGNIEEVRVTHVTYYAYGYEDDVPGGVLDDHAYDEVRLGNQNPDFEGKFAWSGYGSEEFIQVITANGNYHFIVAGEAISDGTDVGDLSGASYDYDTNTLTLNNFEAMKIETNLMGNEFKIRLVGTSRVNQLVVWGAGYGGSVVFTGSGRLIINDHNTTGSIGLMLRCEASESVVKIEDDAVVEIYGKPAIYIENTVAADAIIYSSNHELTGGKEAADEWYVYRDENHPVMDGRVVRNYYISDDEGDMAEYVRIAPKD